MLFSAKPIIKIVNRVGFILAISLLAQQTLAVDSLINKKNQPATSLNKTTLLSEPYIYQADGKSLLFKACEACKEKKFKFHKWASSAIGKPVFCASKTELIVSEGEGEYTWLQISQGIGKGKRDPSDLYARVWDKSFSPMRDENIDSAKVENYSDLLHAAHKKIYAENLVSAPALLMDMFF